MEKNHKGQVIIRSIDELSAAEQKQIRLASLGIGSLVLLIEVLAFLAFGAFPSNSGSLFFYCADWFLFVAVPLASYGLGSSFGFVLMLSDLGYALSLGHGGSDSSSLNQPFSSNESPSYHRSNNYGSHVSINPSSGRPMSGSSGMDISGNPYGTRSW
ncbi:MULTISPECIES: hypothetical protein [Legionella]|uniref:Transmembrane protein n=2 Tax=Legionella TaxID=445 RepID=A0A0W0S9U6_9GAMM|nr:MULTISPECIES: hypothetical protein [Legionella]KTC80114.1 hypothetical protein Lche_2134 [Legionella cherrii]MCL9682821.1 hypothetical protein [Legionella maioricensis]MCL9686551.1 hypothetical protein [Legionella maioricensis]